MLKARLLGASLQVAGLCAAHLCAAPVCAAQVVSVASFGVKPDTGQDVTPGVLRAVEAARAKPGSTLIFPRGKYEFWPEKAHQAKYRISNHDPLETRSVAMPLEAATGLTLDGRGSSFLFHGIILPISIVGGHRVTLKNFSIDYAEQQFLRTRVLTAGDKTATVQVLPGQKYSVADGHVTVQDEDWKTPATASLEIDPATMTVALNARDNYQFARAQVEENTPGTLTLTNIPFAPRVGNILILRPNDRPDPAIWANESSDLLVTHVDVHAAIGMAFIAQKSQDIHLDGLNVTLVEGSGRYLTTNADALHFSNCRGKLLIENGTYENMLDDGINVHGSYLHVIKLIAPSTVLLEWGHVQTYGFTFAAPGEQLEFVDFKTMHPYFHARVARVHPVDEHHVELTLDAPLPVDMHPDDYVDNVDWRPSVIYRHNIVRRIRSRGALFSTTEGVLVEDNRFEKTSGAGILIPGEASKWFESTPSRNVMIRHNTFVDNNLGNRTQGAVSIVTSINAADAGQGYSHRAITIENNDFSLMGRRMVDAFSIDGLTLRNNRLTPSTTYPATPGAPLFSFVHARCVRVESNSPAVKKDGSDISEKDTTLVSVEQTPPSAAWTAACTPPSH